MDQHGDQHHKAPGSEAAERLSTPGRIALWGFAGVAAYFLWTEHRAHLAQFLPWLVFALCPLMHIFMHHGGHHSGSGASQTDAQRGERR